MFETRFSIIVLLTIIVLLCAIFIIAKSLLIWKKKLEKKNTKLIQLYLELKFLYKNLATSAAVNCSTDFCKHLVLSIKEFYNLEEIVIIDSIKIDFKSNNINFLKKEVYNYAQKSSKEIKRRIKNKKYLVQYAEIKSTRYILYIFDLAHNIDCEGFIICIENYPTLLNENELIGLESNVNLLKTRMVSE